MAVGRCRAVALVGLEGHVVEVEADVSGGLPALVLVGLPDAALAEARDRVRAALHNTGLALPARKVTVNLTPAWLPKTGSSFDVAVAVAVLAAGRLLGAASAEGTVHVGELGLDGRLRPVTGVLPTVLAAARAGYERVVVPAANAPEARLVPGVRVVGAVGLADVVRLHGGEVERLGPAGGPVDEPVDAPAPLGPRPRPGPPPDLADVAGQHEARRALEVAAAGGHHLFLSGPPGAGKTMLAARLPGLLPDLSDVEAVEATAVHSLAGRLDPTAGLLRRPPFEQPHHTWPAADVVGGGTGAPRPGAVSRAHRGVLFLDEAPQFSGDVLKALRTPLEDGVLVVSRGGTDARFPARFQLVLAANPCRCGKAGTKGARCECPPHQRRTYLAKLSGPLLDRVDLQVPVQPVSRVEVTAAAEQRPESTAVVAARVAAARAAQHQRWRGTPWRCNGEVDGTLLRAQRWRLPRVTTSDLDRALDVGGLSVRGYDRVLRTAWTLADLAGRAVPGADEVGEALLWRLPDRAAA